MTNNPWIEHVKRYARENNIPYGCAVSHASSTYNMKKPNKIKPNSKINNLTETKKLEQQLKKLKESFDLNISVSEIRTPIRRRGDYIHPKIALKNIKEEYNQVKQKLEDLTNKQYESLLPIQTAFKKYNKENELKRIEYQNQMYDSTLMSNKKFVTSLEKPLLIKGQSIEYYKQFGKNNQDYRKLLEKIQYREKRFDDVKKKIKDLLNRLDSIIKEHKSISNSNKLSNEIKNKMMTDYANHYKNIALELDSFYNPNIKELNFTIKKLN